MPGAQINTAELCDLITRLLQSVKNDGHLDRTCQVTAGVGCRCGLDYSLRRLRQARIALERDADRGRARELCEEALAWLVEKSIAAPNPNAAPTGSGMLAARLAVELADGGEDGRGA